MCLVALAFVLSLGFRLPPLSLGTLSLLRRDACATPGSPAHRFAALAALVSMAAVQRVRPEWAQHGRKMLGFNSEFSCPPRVSL